MSSSRLQIYPFFFFDDLSVYYAALIVYTLLSFAAGTVPGLHGSKYDPAAAYLHRYLPRYLGMQRSPTVRGVYRGKGVCVLALSYRFLILEPSCIILSAVVSPTHTQQGTNLNFLHQKMPLCDVCIAIPFTSLPPFRPYKSSLIKYRSRDKRHGKLPVVSWHDLFSKEQIIFRDFGIPYHENIDALALSASNHLCSLCVLVWEAAQAWKGYMERFEKERIREQQLWITACNGGVPGFYVWIPKAKSYHWVMVAAVGFCVDSSMALDRKPYNYSNEHGLTHTLKLTLSQRRFSRDPSNKILDLLTLWTLQPNG